MDVRKCFEILELDPGASLEEVRQAYKDAVTVWHPDRFAHHPRVRDKAQQKLKDLNLAYEKVSAFVRSRQGRSHSSGRDTDGGAVHETDPGPRAEPEHLDGGGITELVAETGTLLVLHACRALVSAFGRRAEGPGKRHEHSGGRDEG